MLPVRSLSWWKGYGIARKEERSSKDYQGKNSRKQQLFRETVNNGISGIFVSLNHQSQQKLGT